MAVINIKNTKIVWNVIIKQELDIEFSWTYKWVTLDNILHPHMNENLFKSKFTPVLGKYHTSGCKWGFHPYRKCTLNLRKCAIQFSRTHAYDRPSRQKLSYKISGHANLVGIWQMLTRFTLVSHPIILFCAFTHSQTPAHLNLNR